MVHCTSRVHRVLAKCTRSRAQERGYPSPIHTCSRTHVMHAHTHTHHTCMRVCVNMCGLERVCLDTLSVGLLDLVPTAKYMTFVLYPMLLGKYLIKGNRSLSQTNTRVLRHLACDVFCVMYARARAHTHTHTHTHTHARTRTHTNTHTLGHTHTHSIQTRTHLGTHTHTAY